MQYGVFRIDEFKVHRAGNAIIKSTGTPIDLIEKGKVIEDGEFEAHDKLNANVGEREEIEEKVVGDNNEGVSEHKSEEKTEEKAKKNDN